MWVVEYVSKVFEPPRWCQVPTPWQFDLEEEANTEMVKWIFEEPGYKFRVREEMKNDQN